MFVGKIIEFDATILQNFFDAEGSFFAAFTRHYFGAESNIHFGTRPNAGRRHYFIENVFEETHINRLNRLFSYVSFCGAMDELFLQPVRRRIFEKAEQRVFE